ncbi:MAG: GNAT family N-acetyltransferase [Alphaproteobacteria bacterium]|nr:GNAT family N-acetyltransferase [Alphaproteobacteria bacterium]MDX5369583.1 GNAT family N-acetyltransferase [Alphaproteobacteria bacterium]MDX5464237.1 GNAT family N-acetyltransferase [Alphaproteobacteria bacterium]
MPRTLDTVVNYLEMTDDPGRSPRAPSLPGLALLKVEDIPVHYYRYLYDAVGRDWHWVDRKKLSDEDLSAALHRDTVDIYVAHVKGAPAGYFELERDLPDRVLLAYFGLIPDFIGLRLGGWLLDTAIATAWSHAPARVEVETCTLDHPRALGLYQKRGFRPVRRVAKTMALLD